MPVDSLTTFRAAQRVVADVTRMTVIHGVTPPVSGTGSHAKLRPATDELLETPAIVVGSGPITVVPGPVTRFEPWILRCAIWRSRMAGSLDEAYDALIADIGAVVAAVLARGKAYAIDAGLQSLLLGGFEAIDGAEWPPDSNVWYLVAPFTLEIVAQYDTPITPA